MNLRKLTVGLLTVFVFLTNTASAREIFSSFVSHAVESYSDRSNESSLDSRALYSPEQMQPSFKACVDQFPNKQPISLNAVSTNMKPMALCSNNFAVLYSQTSKTPLVVVERLTSAQLQDAKGEQRTDEFYPDPRIPENGRAELSDYRGQQPAVDRGHQAPAADAPDHAAMAQSFSLSNCIPQNPFHNRKIWSKVESDVRKFARRANGNVFVFTGPLFDKGHETVGRNRVWKPTRLFKLVYDESSRRAWAYVLPNTAEAVIEAPMDYSSFVQVTGLHLLDNVRPSGSVRN